MTLDSPDPNSNKCLRQFTDGRSCRMSRKNGHATLCIFHAREEQQLLESDKLAAEFASLSGKLTDINHVLGKVFTALAEKRISHQTAETFGTRRRAGTAALSSLLTPTPCCARTSRFPADSASNKPKPPPTPLE